MFRSPYTALALRHQLDGLPAPTAVIEAMVIADADGLPVACSGDRDVLRRARRPARAQRPRRDGRPASRRAGGEGLLIFRDRRPSPAARRSRRHRGRARHPAVARPSRGARRILAA